MVLRPKFSKKRKGPFVILISVLAPLSYETVKILNLTTL